VIALSESGLIQSRDPFADTDFFAFLDKPAMEVSVESQRMVFCLLYDVANPSAVVVIISRHG
jgi:hypothetical protein